MGWSAAGDLVLEFASGAATRLTPPKLFARQPRWMGPGEFVFVSQVENEKHPSIYRAPVDNLKARKLLVKNANARAAPDRGICGPA